MGDEDEPFLLAVYAGTRAEELARTDWDDARKDAFVRMQFDAQARSYGEQYAGASFDVVLVANRPAGRLYVDRREDAIHVLDVALLPEFRGQGIGSGLLRHLMEEAGAAGKPLTLYVERFNRALRLYDRLGFAVAGEEGIYLRLEWRPR